MSEHTHNFPAITQGQIGEDAVQTVNARDLHAFLEIGKDFSTWIKDRIVGFGFSEHADFEMFEDLSSPNLGSSKSRAQPIKEYALTIDMAKELSMVERNEKGKTARAYFIECERKLKQQNPLAEAMVMSALNDPGAMRGLLLTYTEKVIALQQENAALGVKAEAHDRIADAYGTFCRSTAAKNLGVPPHTLCRWMRTNGWTFRRTGDKDDLAYQNKIAGGLLEHKVAAGPRQDGTEWSRTQVRVTPKGMLALAKAFPPAVSEVKKGGMAAALIGAAALTMALAGSPQPAKAFPAHEGQAVFYLDGKHVTVDTTKFDGGSFEHFLCIGSDGKLDRCLLRTPASGNRAFWEQERNRRPGEPVMADSVSGIVHVIGAIVA